MEWKNLDTLTSFEELSKVAEVDLTKVMSGENGAERVKKYSTPMAVLYFTFPESGPFRYDARYIFLRFTTALLQLFLYGIPPHFLIAAYDAHFLSY